MRKRWGLREKEIGEVRDKGRKRWELREKEINLIGRHLLGTYSTSSYTFKWS